MGWISQFDSTVHVFVFIHDTWVDWTATSVARLRALDAALRATTPPPLKFPRAGTYSTHTSFPVCPTHPCLRHPRVREPQYAPPTHNPLIVKPAPTNSAMQLVNQVQCTHDWTVPGHQLSVRVVRIQAALVGLVVETRREEPSRPGWPCL